MTTAVPMAIARRPAATRRLRSALMAVAATAAVIGLGASVTVYVARGAIVAKAESAAAAFGLDVVIRDVDIPLFGGIALRGVDVTRPDGTPVAALERVETDVSLIGAALGERRPGEVTIIGGHAVLRWDDGPSDLRRAAPDGEASGGSGGGAIALHVRDLDLVIEARHTTPLGVVEVEPLQVDDLSATLVRDPAGGSSARAEGTLAAAGHRSAFSAAVDLGAGSIDFSAADGLAFGVATPHGALWVALNEVHHAHGQPWVARGVGLRRGDERLQLGEVHVRAAGVGLLPSADAIQAIEVAGLVLERGEDRATVGSAAVALVEDEHGAALPGAITLRDVEGVVSRGGRKVTGRVGELEIRLSGLARHLANGGLLSAVTSVRLAAPSVSLVLPPRAPNGGEAAAARAPVTGDGEPPPFFLGDDEDLPPPGAVVPALAPGRDWLASLLGVDDEGDGASFIERFVPEELGARLPGLLERLGALAPEVSDGTLTALDSEGATLLTLQGVGFSAATASDSGNVRLALRAAVLHDGREAGRADLRIDLTRELELDALEGTISGRSLAHQMARFVSGLSVQEDSEFDLEIRYQRPRADDAPHHVQGVLRLASFSFEFWRIADREIRDLEATLKFDASIDRKNHRLVLSLPEIAVGKARLSASLDLTRRKGHLPSFVARLEMPRQDCGDVARSIPRGLIPNLPTLAMRGELDFKAQLALDLERPRELELDVTGHSDACEVVSLGPGIDIEGLRGLFVHHPVEPKRGVLTHISVGRGTREWVPSERLPDIVKTAAWVTEDRRFEDHGGVRWDLVERALKIDLDYGRFIYGGSTITQQLVKNLYLTRDKNLARKLEEAIIAWQMERVLTKDEILTIYINCIEYGPDIYGIKQAARIYFDKRVGDLDALEAAFIMGLKPYPSAGYRQFTKEQLDPWWIRRVSHVLRLMAKFQPDQLSAEDAEAFAPFQPAFHRP